MGENEWLADQFEEHRAHLRAVAYRMLGSLTEGDDAVQDTWLRLSRSGTGDVENLGGWLTTIVARVCLNTLRSRNARREESIEVRLPDPIISRDERLQPEEEALLADSVGLALLERLAGVNGRGHRLDAPRQIARERVGDRGGAGVEPPLRVRVDPPLRALRRGKQQIERPRPEQVRLARADLAGVVEGLLGVIRDDVADLGGAVTECAADDKHHWLVLRTTAQPRERDFDYFVDF